ncbi:DNA-binding GntR family transcriptional regulator [Angulomicrobium tetraedrale]|uniref:DNA-binding GntR family transcriptional regulator n=1 Tax=Ancylobacter tetraedralis TaxID=217068 RepID=A0A839Z3C4_9HYPH|nr:GntR family transcriptional regulator [Ancylobacter tetraedralis]MBB3770152.1 DNA-binding GntR family transcriptional regulator [Ancylobacter tetraedralis]
MTDQIVTELRRQIIVGQLPEGAPLRQEKLASELGVSRVPLREAIRQLEAEGLVVSELHKGTVVSSLSLEEIEELFEIRMRMETWLFEVAIPRLTEEDFALAEAVTDEAMASGSVENWGELNWRFHETLYRPSGHLIALKLLRTVHDNANRYVNLQIAVAEDVERELSDHRALIAFARLGDIRRAVDTLRAHIQRVSRNLIMSLAEGRLGKARDIA